jgi:hypothetical protein
MPSGHDVHALPMSSTSILEILVGLVKLSTRRPRSIDAGTGWYDLRPPVKSTVRRKSTDSVRRMATEFFFVLWTMANKIGGGQRSRRT